MKILVAIELVWPEIEEVKGKSTWILCVGWGEGNNRRVVKDEKMCFFGREVLLWQKIYQ